MRRIAIMATFPARAAAVVTALESIAAQVDKVVVVLNEYATVPPPLAGLAGSNVEFVLPADDFKDTGKFCYAVRDDDQVVLCDDDLVYPPDYVARLAERWQAYRSLDAVVGVHGIVYSDFFDGTPSARMVYHFGYHLSEDVFVNQLGTATVLLGGHQMPDFAFVRTGRRFVDVRFALHCARANRPMICLARERGWLQEAATAADASVFETFTRHWPLAVVAEVQQIAGLRFLPALTPTQALTPADSIGAPSGPHRSPDGHSAQPLAFL